MIVTTPVKLGIPARYTNQHPRPASGEDSSPFFLFKRQFLKKYQMFRKPWFFIAFIAFFAIIGLIVGHLVVKYLIPMSGANMITFRDIAGTYFFCTFIFGVIAYLIALSKV